MRLPGGDHVYDAATAAAIGPYLADALQRAHVLGTVVDPRVVAAADECNQTRRALADVADGVADVADRVGRARRVAHDARMTVPQAARKYGVKQRTLRDHCQRGYVGVLVGGHYEITDADMEAYLGNRV